MISKIILYYKLPLFRHYHAFVMLIKFDYKKLKKVINFSRQLVYNFQNF